MSNEDLFKKLIKNKQLESETIVLIYQDYAFIQTVRVFYAFFTSIKIHWDELIQTLHHIDDAKRDKHTVLVSDIMKRPIYVLYQYIMKLVLTYQHKLENVIDKMIETEDVKESENGPMTILLTVQEFYRKYKEARY